MDYEKKIKLENRLYRRLGRKYGIQFKCFEECLKMTEIEIEKKEKEYKEFVKKIDDFWYKWRLDYGDKNDFILKIVNFIKNYNF